MDEHEVKKRKEKKKYKILGSFELCKVKFSKHVGYDSSFIIP